MLRKWKLNLSLKKEKTSQSETETTIVDHSEIKKALSWLDSNGDQIPEKILGMIRACLLIADKVTDLSAKNKLLRNALGLFFNQESKSEKSSSDVIKKDDSSKDDLFSSNTVSVLSFL